MKKSTIWLLAVIMALTFVSLLAVQLMYMENMIKMRNEQFTEAAKRSLYAVSTTLELDETKRYLLEELEESQSRLLSSYGNRNQNQDLVTLRHQFSIETPDGAITGFSFLREQSDITFFPPAKPASPNKNSNSLIDSYSNLQELLKGKYLYQRGLLNEVILNILSKASTRPILERIDPKKLDGYLKSELENNGLNVPYHFAIFNKAGRKIYQSEKYNPSSGTELFTQMIFQNDPPNRAHYLKVYFPTQQDYIFSSIRFMIPSFAFTIILLVVFLFTIITVFRQKKLTEMKNDFINNMTHEFKTPISTISLAAQMLNDPGVTKSPDMFRHISGVINEETKRLRFQVEKVLQMSMFDRQKTQMKLHTVDVNDVITGVMSTFKLKVESYGGAIDAELEAEDAMVEVDEMHFTNVIFNLLDNAVKYRREDVPLSLLIRTRTVGDRAEISIQDNGIGIKKENLKKIFEKFYRVSTGNRHDVKGFGLGLAYVYKIIKDLKGDIRAESELNEGSTFIITLPLIKK